MTLVQEWTMLEGAASALHVHSALRGSGSQRASATLGLAWPRPPAARCPRDPDTLAGRTGVAWQQGRDWIGCARSRDRPGSGVSSGPRPGLGGSGAARSHPCPRSASAQPRLGPWPPTRTARALGLALPRAPRCRTRASCGMSSRGAAGRAGACGPPLGSSRSQPRAFPRPVTPASSPTSFLVPQAPVPCSVPPPSILGVLSGRLSSPPRPLPRRPLLRPPHPWPSLCPPPCLPQSPGPSQGAEPPAGGRSQLALGLGLHPSPLTAGARSCSGADGLPGMLV